MSLNYLQQWGIDHRLKIIIELEQAGIELKKENIEKIIKETSFSVRSKKDSNECDYYSKGRSCHPEIEDLNCFLCACPNYDSSILEGGCNINSEKGKFTYHENLPAGKVWDCSKCNIPHSPEFVRKYLEETLK